MRKVKMVLVTEDFLISLKELLVGEYYKTNNAKAKLRNYLNKVDNKQSIVSSIRYFVNMLEPSNEKKIILLLLENMEQKKPL